MLEQTVKQALTYHVQQLEILLESPDYRFVFCATFVPDSNPNEPQSSHILRKTG
jgi:hypothetical protein